MIIKIDFEKAFDLLLTIFLNFNFSPPFSKLIIIAFLVQVFPFLLRKSFPLLLVK